MFMPFSLLPPFYVYPLQAQALHEASFGKWPSTVPPALIRLFPSLLLQPRVLKASHYCSFRALYHPMLVL